MFSCDDCPVPSPASFLVFLHSIVHLLVLSFLRRPVTPRKYSHKVAESRSANQEVPRPLWYQKSVIYVRHCIHINYYKLSTRSAYINIPAVFTLRQHNAYCVMLCVTISMRCVFTMS
jgi:hypothetical protein